jgi:protein N-terminal methyltransferase
MDQDESGPAPDSLISKEDGLKYWEGVNADVDGMLGGIPAVTRVDLQGSRNFLAKLGIGSKDGLRVVGSALEGGAGYVGSYRKRAQAVAKM